MRTPALMLGGKGHMVGKLVPMIPEHRIYIEVFGGGAALLFAKNPYISDVEVYNDVDKHLVDFFTVVRDPNKFERLCERLRLTPFSREEFRRARATWQSEPNEIERVAKWFVLLRQSFGTNFGISWGLSTETKRKSPLDLGYISMSVASWLKVLKDFPVIHWRLMRVQIECRDWRKCLSLYRSPDTFAYLDPPYVPGTREAGGYRYDMTEDDHIKLVEVLLKYPGMIMLSGYPSQVYTPLENAGWSRTDFRAVCRVAGRVRHSRRLREAHGLINGRQVRIESIWRNPLCVKNTPK